MLLPLNMVNFENFRVTFIWLSFYMYFRVVSEVLNSRTSVHIGVVLNIERFFICENLEFAMYQIHEKKVLVNISELTVSATKNFGKRNGYSCYCSNLQDSFGDAMCLDINLAL